MFQRPNFSPIPIQGSIDRGDLISSLPDLVRFNSKHNPHHVFCFQAEVERGSESDASQSGRSYTAINITFKDLERATNICASWINQKVDSVSLHGSASYFAPKNGPVALYLESDVGHFIHFAALLTLNIPVLLLSARLSAQSVEHLLQKTGSKLVLVSGRTQSRLNTRLKDSTRLVMVQNYLEYLNAAGSTDYGIAPLNIREQDCGGRNAIILHSSGTTGLPKPISVSHYYPLVYASCHKFEDEEVFNWVNLSTLPLYHGFGLLAPCLSLSIGMSCVFPPPCVIPSACSTLDLIRHFSVRSLMTVPSIIDDMLTGPKEKHRTTLRQLAALEFLAVGGGALNPEHGLMLAQNHIPFLNHYGATEIGPVAPIFKPQSDYNWRYLRLRSDIGLQLHDVPGSSRWRLRGPSANGDGMFEVQDELERNPDAKPENVEVRILGRTDDLIILKTGEKVRPKHLEDALITDPDVRTAVCIGQGFFEVAVIIEPVDHGIDPKAFTEHLWTLISAINPSLDAHARVSSKHAIIIKDSNKTIPRSDKGSVLRRVVHEHFQSEIELAYATMESDLPVLVDPFILKENPEVAIRALLASIASERFDADTIASNEDFFEHGMDSLQAVQVARLLSVTMKATGSPAARVTKINAEFIYRHPSIRELAAAGKIIAFDSVDAGSVGGPVPVDRTAGMLTVLGEMMADLEQIAATRPVLTSLPIHTVLITGATGNLGAHTLARLTRMKSVAKVICLCRRGKSPGFHRQQHALSSAGLTLTVEEWAKVEILENLEVLQQPVVKAPNTDIDTLLERLSTEVTHVIHLAWPMNFQRTLPSFRPHLILVQQLIELARRAHIKRPGLKVRLLFSSSIAVVRHAAPITASGAIPEEAVTDPLASTPMGYAKAKWVCENLLDYAGREFGSELDPLVVRIGQLSGPVSTNGVWKSGEHIPALLKASQKIGALPSLEGTISWLPIDTAAQCLVEFLLCPRDLPRFLHLENPTRQPIQEALAVWGRQLGFTPQSLIPFDLWLQMARELGAFSSLEEFFKDHFRDISHRAVILDTKNAEAVSETLRGSLGVDTDLLIKYAQRWQAEGFLA